MFLLNSCLGLFSAACSRRRPFSRSYGAILPSSLTMLLPPALGFSPHPPVSVYGTGTHTTIAAFLGSSARSFRPCGLRVSASPSEGDLPPSGPSPCTGFFIPGSSLRPASPQFCMYVVQDYQPVVHRLRLSASP